MTNDEESSAVCSFQCVQRGWISQKKLATLLLFQQEWSYKSFSAVADGGRRERPMIKSLSKMFILYSKMKEKNKCKWKEGEEGQVSLL